MEDKIFGPLSFKEFIYLAGGAGLSYMIYRFTPSFLLALLLIAPVMSFAIALSFYRPNNKPFIDMVQSAIVFFFGQKLYIWKKEKKPMTTREVDVSDRTGINLEVPTLSGNKLTGLNWDIGVNSKKDEKVENIKDTLNIQN